MENLLTYTVVSKSFFWTRLKMLFRSKTAIQIPKTLFEESKDTQGNNSAPGGQKRNQKQRKTLILQTCRTAICFAIAVKNPQRDCKLGFLYEAYIEKVSPKRHSVVGKGTQHKNLSDSSQSSKQRRLRKAFKRRRRSEKRRMGRRLNKLWVIFF